jgi:hypothetical protein
MTMVQILAAAAGASVVILVAKGALFLHASSDPRPSFNVTTALAEIDSDGPVSRKGDRLPVLALPVSTVSGPAPAFEAPQEIQAATKDDLRQADEERHRKRDICPRGRSYFTMDHHQYWRCRR